MQNSLTAVKQAKVMERRRTLTVGPQFGDYIQKLTKWKLIASLWRNKNQSCATRLRVTIYTSSVRVNTILSFLFTIVFSFFFCVTYEAFFFKQSWIEKFKNFFLDQISFLHEKLENDLLPLSVAAVCCIYNPLHFLLSHVNSTCMYWHTVSHWNSLAIACVCLWNRSFFTCVEVSGQSLKWFIKI